MNKKFLSAFFAFLAFFVFFPHNSYAYLDPGSGSYLLQILLAGLLTVSFAFKSFWRNIKAFLAGIFSRPRRKPDSNRSSS